VDEAEGRRRQELLLFASLGSVFDQRRRVPFTKHNSIAFGLEPLMQEHQLRRLARAINTFDNKKPSGNAMITVAFHAEKTKEDGRDDDQTRAATCPFIVAGSLFQGSENSISPYKSFHMSHIERGSGIIANGSSKAPCLPPHSFPAAPVDGLRVRCECLLPR